MKFISAIAFLWLAVAECLAGDAAFTNFLDFQGKPQQVRMAFAYFLDSPVTNVTKDRVIFRTDTAGGFTMTNYYAGNYRVEFQGTDRPTTNWFEFPTTNGTINAFDAAWRRTPTNGITQALTAAAGNAAFMPLPTNNSTATTGQVASKTGDKTKWIDGGGFVAGRTFYVAPTNVTSTPQVNDAGHPYSVTNLYLSTPLIATNEGDVIAVLPGNYFISNNAPVRISQGVTLRGINSPVFHVDTNGPQEGRLDYSTFQPQDNATVRGIIWEATNTWNTTDVGGHAYASFLMSGPIFTNVLVDRCQLQGGSDVFYATNSGTCHFILQNSRIQSLWDIFSAAGICDSINNTWTGLGAASRPTRLVNISLIDHGSKFEGFAGMDNAHGFNTALVQLFGSYMDFTPLDENYIDHTRHDTAGSYYQNLTNAQKVYDIGPAKACYITNSTTTNVVYAFNRTNILVVRTGGAADANIDGTYVLGTTDGNFATGLSFWTNQSHTTYVLRLNDPADVALESIPPTFGIYSANTSKALGSVPTWDTVVGAGQNVFSLEDGDVSVTATLQTNSITTNRIPLLYSSVFNGALAFVTNGAIVARGTNYFVGNGSGLTNLPSAATPFDVTQFAPATAGTNIRSGATLTNITVRGTGGGLVLANGSITMGGGIVFTNAHFGLGGGAYFTNWDVQLGTVGVKLMTPGNGTSESFRIGPNGISFAGSVNTNWDDANSAINSILGGAFQTNVAFYGVIAGGEFNCIGPFDGSHAGSTSTRDNGIFTGARNSISNGAAGCFIGGGNTNLIGGVDGILSATIPGGTNCQAGASRTFAAGTRAKALNAGAFVWGDSQEADFSSTASDTFNVRAQNGAFFTGALSATNGVLKQIVTKTGDYGAGPSDEVILINGATKTVTLPTAASIGGKVYTIKLIASGTTGTIATTSSQNIDGATTYSLSAQYKYATVISNGTQWYIIANN